jgi:hypothetical protein
MTAKEALATIKGLLKTKFSEEETGKFEISKLSDGTEVQYSKLEAGGDFSILDKDGVANPAPAGEYELEDARIVVVTEPGKIAELKDKSAEAEDPKEGEQQAQKMAESDPVAGGGAAVLDWSDRIQDLQRQLTWVVEAYANLKNAMTAFKADTNNVITQVVGFMEIVAGEDKEGAATPPKQTVFSEQKKKKEGARQKALDAFAAFSEKVKEKK